MNEIRGQVCFIFCQDNSLSKRVTLILHFLKEILGLISQYQWLPSLNSTKIKSSERSNDLYSVFEINKTPKSIPCLCLQEIPYALDWRCV